MSKKWFYADNDMQKGPVSAERLKGLITEDTLVWCDGMADWLKAGDVKELAHLFLVVPPPIPNTEEVDENRTKHVTRIVDSVYYGWGVLLFTALAGILEFTDRDNTRFYSLVVFLGLVAMARVFLGLKSYLSNILHFDRANININWIIVTMIPLCFFGVIDARHNLEQQLSENTYLVLMASLLIISLLYAYHYLKLVVKLFKVEDTSISSFKIFAFLQIFTFGLLLGLMIILNEKELIFWETFFNLIPLLFLVLGLRKVRNKYIQQ